ncbi:serine protease [Streptomyces sp. NPDC052236]|uniref:serine protease n=1 Tax=Streptomyces sp. NPDC052236 TaxID=3365686 RepID=UPI0037D7531D
MAAKLAEIFGGEGSKSALSHIAARSPREVAVVAEKSLDTLFHSLKSSIVRLIVDDQPAASGFFVAPGRVLTTAHALRTADARAEVQLNTGEKLNAMVVAWDNDTDLALLETGRQDLPALTLQAPGRSEEEVAAIIGEEITAIGYVGSSPEPQVRVGLITDIKVRVRGFSGDAMITTKLDTAYGFSSSPAVNAKGHVIGVVRLYSSGGYNLLISADSVLRFLDGLGVVVSVSR